MNERLKQLREELKLTQQEFADKLGIKRGTIANYEVGRNEPIDAVISLICYKFQVNEDWLRTGKGRMFLQTDRQQEVLIYIGKLMTGRCTDIENAIMKVMAKTTYEEWELIEKKARELVEAMDKKEPDHD